MDFLDFDLSANKDDNAFYGVNQSQPPVGNRDGLLLIVRVWSQWISHGDINSDILSKSYYFAELLPGMSPLSQRHQEGTAIDALIIF